MISKELEDILACPKCKGDIKILECRIVVVCESCQLKYSVDNDIPIMLIDRAEKII